MWYNYLRNIVTTLHLEEETREVEGHDMPACLSLQKTQKVGLARETIKVFPACVYLSRGELGIQIGSHGREEFNRFCFSET